MDNLKIELNVSDIDASESDASENDSSDSDTSNDNQHDLLIKFIIHGHHPYQIVKEEDFRTFLSALNTSYRLPSKIKLSTSIQKLYNKKKLEMIHLIQEHGKKVSLTIDLWTSVTNKTYIITAAHFVAKNGELISMTLEFDHIPFPDEIQIVSKVKSIIQEFDIEVISITTDNKNCIAFQNEFKGVVVVPCMAHILNYVIRQGLEVVDKIVMRTRKIINFIVLSPKNQQLYKECCNTLDILHLPLLKDSPNRWISTYMMLLRALKMKAVLNSMCSKYAEFAPYTIKDWENVEEVVDILQPFHEATAILSKHYYPSVCYVVPIVDVITQHLTSHLNGRLHQCALVMSKHLSPFSDSLKCEMAQISSLLDPRVNNEYFISKAYSKALYSLRALYQQFKESNIKIEEAKSSPSNQFNSGRKSLFDSVYKKAEMLDEIDLYVNMPSEPEDTNIILWWKNKKETSKSLANLAKLALNILAIPATCVPSEEAFSIQGDIIAKKRNRLGSNHMQASMCLSSWLKIEKIIQN